MQGKLYNSVPGSKFQGGQCHRVLMGGLSAPKVQLFLTLFKKPKTVILGHFIRCVLEQNQFFPAKRSIFALSMLYIYSESYATKYSFELSWNIFST